MLIKNLSDFSYVGTNQGLFFKNNYSNDDFQLVDGTSGQVWSLVELDGELFVATIKEPLLLKIQ